MKINKNTLKRFGVIGIFISIFFFISGYRLTGIQAAKIHSDIDRDARLLGKVSYKWGTIYLFNTHKGYRTVVSERRGLFWKSKNSFFMGENSDLIKTVGWADIHDLATVYAIEVTDEKVEYIEVGPQSDRIRKHISDDSLVIFSWDKSIRWNDFDGLAYSKEGVPIYEYRYPKDTNSLKYEDLRWYPIKIFSK